MSCAGVSVVPLHSAAPVTSPGVSKSSMISSSVDDKTGHEIHEIVLRSDRAQISFDFLSKSTEVSIHLNEFYPICFFLIGLNHFAVPSSANLNIC